LQPPGPAAPPEQHGCPDSPQATQVFAVPQVDIPLLHVEPWQQLWPICPQAVAAEHVLVTSQT
jgi:hypothetical protein